MQVTQTDILSALKSSALETKEADGEAFVRRKGNAVLPGVELTSRFKNAPQQRHAEVRWTARGLRQPRSRARAPAPPRIPLLHCVLPFWNVLSPSRLPRPAPPQEQIPRELNVMSRSLTGRSQC